MSSNPGYPHLPGPHQPARRPLSPLWLVPAIGLIVVSLVASVIFVAALIRSELPDETATYLDDWDILEVVEVECIRMTTRIEDMTVTGTPDEQSAVILDQNEAVEAMLARVRKIDRDILAADEPAIAWLADWDKLLDARRDFAALVAQGKTTEFELPTDRVGDPIIDRMDWASEPECVVPDALLDPYPVEQNEI